jgi:hypothetical protein
MLTFLRQGALVGVIATLFMDILTGLSIRLGLVAPLPPALIGRWFASVARAQPIHADIAQVPAFRYELPLAIVGHYTIGITLACFYLWLTARLDLPTRSAGVALAYGLCTNVLPWLLMFPSMGYGFFGSHGPADTRLFASSLTSHAFYGVGLWLAVRFVIAK